jgi:hypothetical protein
MAEAESPRRRILSEAVLLAMSTALTYAIAFLYETGFADCYGYPKWLIDIGLANLALAWVSVALALFALQWLYFIVGSLIPAKLVTKVLLTRAGLFTIWGTVMIVVAPSMHDRFQTIGMMIGGVLVCLLVIPQVWIGFRNAGAALSFIDRIAAGAEYFARWHDTNSINGKPDQTLTMTTLKSPVFGEAYAFSIAILLPCAIIMALANGFGTLMASSDREYWVSTDKPPLVALRRYGESVIATPIEMPDSPTRARPVQVLPWRGDRTWAFRVPDSVALSRLRCR